jgi:SecD/SecF fusion protein
MISFRAAVTLPGLAGLVLTVGMSVDANVLIFERLREELDRGSALRMAIRNGFGRATTTIVDANLTTLITAIVLYAIGTDQIRGFAVTLILGILMSMFTAIFCSRVVFDLFERKRRLTSLSMMRMLGETNIDFLARRKIAGVISVLVIAVGLVAVGIRGKQIFDIDFVGGTSVTMILKQPADSDEIRSKLDEEFEDVRVEGSSVQCSVNRVDVVGQPENTVWKIDTSLAEVGQLQSILQNAFPVAYYSMDFGDLKETRTVAPVADKKEATASKMEEPVPEAEPKPKEKAEAKPEAEAEIEPEPKPEAKPDEKPEPVTPETKPDVEPKEKVEPETKEPPETETEPKANDEAASRTDLPPDTVFALAGAGDLLIAQAGQSGEAKEAEEDEEAAAKDDTPAEKPDDQQPAGKTEMPEEPETTPSEGETKETVLTETLLTFGHAINGLTLRAEILDAAEASELPLTEENVTLRPAGNYPDWRIEDAKGYKEWRVSLAMDQETAGQVFTQMESELAETPVWPSSSRIGGKVAGDTRTLAIAALLTSLMGIIGYIWIRFQRVVYGLAAVIALVHDVLITLGAIAVSYWLAGVLGFLLVEEFKISLPVVAALLTIIGYSLNDTIVVFDRIREVRGKSPQLTSDMINTSINQTLSRTLLTSLTTFIVVAILYALGGQGIHGFAFALVVGVIVGTYSSIFVASPVLLWMSQPKKPAG